MPSIDTTNLEQIADVDFETFEAAHDVGNNIAVAYYNELRNQGDEIGNENIENYGNLAKAVASNDGLNGKYANAHTKAVGDAESVDMTVGSGAWLEMQFELMKRDIQARKAAIALGGTGELDQSETDRIHTESLNEVGMPPEGFSLHVPLKQIAERSPEAAQEVFVSVLPGNGALDFIADGTKLGFGAAGNALIDSNRSLHDLLQDFSQQAGWLETALTALDDLGNSLPGGLPTEAQDLLDNLQAIANLAENGLGFLAPWADKLKDLSIPPGLVNLLPLPVKLALLLWGQAPAEGSPLVLDIDGDGVELTAFDPDTTYAGFDIDADGFAEQTAWVGGDDGLLVRDLDSSGTIDSSAELFGSATIDGFALLASFDLNSDHVINQYDAVWADLLIWQDVNEDAITQDGELHTLASLDIVSIDLAGIAPSSSTISGNPITHTSTYRLGNGTSRSVVDAWFVHDNTNTRYLGEYELDIRTLFLPTLRGFGKLPDLNIAMSQNEDLLLLVQDFATNWDTSRFEEGAAVTADIEEILWTWAGVESVSPTSRGPNIDARNLEFMERYFGNDFLQNGVEPNPQPFAAEVLKDAWHAVITYLEAHLVFQAGAADLFNAGNTYDLVSGDLSGDLELTQSGVDELELSAPLTGIEEYWIEVGHFLHTVRGLNDLSVGEVDMLDEAVVATDAGLSWDYIKNEVLSTIEGDTIDGTSGNDTITGTQYADVLNGHDGDDTISGGDGHDELSGGDGADTLDGGAGNDTLTGYLGNDTFRAGTGGNFVFGGGGDDLYEYEGGNDVYSEIGDYTGTDKIVLPSGVVANDLSFFQVATGSQPGSLFIDIDGLGRIETPYFSAYGGNLITDRIETIEFSDTSTFNFNTLTSLTTYGTDEDNYVYGIQFSSHLDDTLYGLGGNDYLYGQDGNDTLDGGLGNDILNGNAGDDVYIFSAGFDTINEEGGDDTIMLPAGYDAGDISFVRLGGSSYHLELRVDGLGQLLIQGQLYPGPSNGTVETISFNGSSSIDILDLQVETIGSSSTDYLYGIEGGASIDDIMDGREGDDYLYGFAGDDTYYFSLGNDVISELSGDDTIRFRSGWDPEDVSIYRQGTTLILADQNGNSLSAQQHFTQSVYYDNSAYSIEQIVFANSTVWTLASMEIVTLGTAGSDTIDGTVAGDASNADTIFGLGGNDTLSGYDGDDVLDGGDGDDTFYGGAGNDRFVAGIGLDYVSDHGVGTDVLHVTGGVTINDITIADYGSYYDSKIVIDSGVDEIHIAQLRYWDTDYVIELVTFDDGFTTSLPDYGTWLTGTSGNDVSAGNGSDNTIIGLAGNDTITGAGGNDDAHGGAGEDSLDGGDGNDLLYGGDDDDILYGKAGLDTMHGGDGADTFVFETASAFSDIDVIRDFSVTDADVLDLTDILDTVYDPMTDAIADFVEFTESSGSTFVSVDRDGTGGTYSMAQIIKLENVTGLASPDTLETNGNLLAA